MTKKQGAVVAVRIQPRDHDLLMTLHAFDGVLSWRQAKEHFYGTQNDSTFTRRMWQLRGNKYIHYPTAEQLQIHPVSEKIIWLGVKGIAYIVEQMGAMVEEPKSESEDALKKYHSRLRKQGIRWKRELDWIRLPHHLAVCDFRFLAKQAAEKAGLLWGRWLPESDFWVQKDYVTYSITERKNGREEVVKKHEAFHPDGFWDVFRPIATLPDKKEVFAFLPEIDRGTETIKRVVEEKVLRGQVYLKSEAYRKRSGTRWGRQIIVTTGEERALNIKRAAESVTRKPSCYFSWVEALTVDNLYTEPVWYLLGKPEPVPLLPPSRY